MFGNCWQLFASALVWELAGHHSRATYSAFLHLAVALLSEKRQFSRFPKTGLLTKRHHRTMARSVAYCVAHRICAQNRVDAVSVLSVMLFDSLPPSVLHHKATTTQCRRHTTECAKVHKVHMSARQGRVELCQTRRPVKKRKAKSASED